MADSDRLLSATSNAIAPNAHSHPAPRCHHYGWQRSMGCESGLARIEGHERGTENIRQITQTAGEIGIEYLTLWAFPPRTGAVLARR